MNRSSTARPASPRQAAETGRGAIVLSLDRHYKTAGGTYRAVAVRDAISTSNSTVRDVMANFSAARLNMVESQLRTNKVTHAAILNAFEATPREVFVPEARRGIAYVDEDIEIGPGRYLMEPMVLARLLQAANPGPGDVILDVGCGTGYGTALLARLAATVVALEDDPVLAETASRTLADLGVDNAVVVSGDLSQGYPAQAPYNVILIHGAVGEVPDAIGRQLADGGRLVTVVKDSGNIGRATLVERHGDVISGRVLFDAAVPVLPAFQKEPGFVF